MKLSSFWVPFAVGTFLLKHPAGVEGEFTSVPVNTLSEVGKTTRLNCSTNLNQSVYWARTLAGFDVQQWLYYGKNGFNGHNADGRFSMDKNVATGRYDVIISNVQQKDAGQYVCVDEAGLGARTAAELVVSDSINCKSHIPSDGIMGYNPFGIEKDYIEVSCRITYAGNLSPTLKWNFPGPETPSDKYEVTAAKSFIISTLKMSPAQGLNNMKIQCKVEIDSTTQHTIYSGLAWESDNVSVRYAEFRDKEVDECPGVKWNLVCNPECFYQFERRDDGCQCLYTYNDTRTQQIYKVTSDFATCGKENDTSPNAVTVTAIVVAAFLALLTTMMSVAVCYVMKRRNREIASGKSSRSISVIESISPMIKRV